GSLRRARCRGLRLRRGVEVQRVRIGRGRSCGSVRLRRVGLVRLDLGRVFGGRLVAVGLRGRDDHVCVGAAARRCVLTHWVSMLFWLSICCEAFCMASCCCCRICIICPYSSSLST